MYVECGDCGGHFDIRGTMHNDEHVDDLYVECPFCGYMEYNNGE